MISIDSLSWNNSDYEQQRAIDSIIIGNIEDARSYILPKGRKDCWENCDRVLTSMDEELFISILPELFEWFQDLNWPGYEIIANRLFHLPKNIVQPAFDKAIHSAQSVGDYEWEDNLICLFVLNEFKYTLPTPLWTSLDYEKK